MSDYINNENYHDDYSKTLKVSSIVEDQYSDISGDVIKANTYKMLEQEFFALFEASSFYNKYKNPKKLERIDYETAFDYFRKNLEKDNKFSLIEIFMFFAEFFEANYKILYSVLTNMDKETIMIELGTSHNIKNKVKTAKLF
ncbi:MAG: hypothetical protein RSE41_09970 [Clostridia bacterium]